MALRMAVILIIIAIFAAAAPTALSETLNEAGENVDVTDETWTPTAGSVTTLDQSNKDNVAYDEAVVVRDSNGNRVYSPEDYRWFESNGTIKTVTGGQLDGETSATIDYSYQATTEQQRSFAALMSQIPNIYGLALPVFALLFALLVVRG